MQAYRGFESHPLRQWIIEKPLPARGCGFFVLVRPSFRPSQKAAVGEHHNKFWASAGLDWKIAFNRVPQPLAKLTNLCGGGLLALKKLFEKFDKTPDRDDEFHQGGKKVDVRFEIVHVNSS